MRDVLPNRRGPASGTVARAEFGDSDIACSANSRAGFDPVSGVSEKQGHWQGIVHPLRALMDPACSRTSVDQFENAFEDLALSQSSSIQIR